jgi:pyrimidine-nucleoside phosphorylase
MTAYEIITRKRDGKQLSDSEIEFMINGFVTNRIPKYQMSAFLMAIFFNGMNFHELNHLTNVFLNSGKRIDLSHLKNKKIDKHSTGGVGDKVSIILAPLVAAAGVYVPMISGRGLGHTGGTLDKLQSIPGFKTNYSIKEFTDQMSKIGVCLAGQTDELVPADKKIYALRDVTATVPSIPLITASIMSKKLAEGIDGLVLDIKVGKGAFLTEISAAKRLAYTLIEVGEKNGVETVAYLTDMSNPLGNTVGNWIEILECIDCLQGKVSGPLKDVTLQLAGAMLFLAQKAESIQAGVEQCKILLENGTAWQKFLDIVSVQGGDIGYLEHPEKYPKAKFQKDYYAQNDGWIHGINALDVGLAAVELGAGRQKVNDRIDPVAGISLHANRGAPTKKGEPIFTIFTNRKHSLDGVYTRLQNAIDIKDDQPAASKDIIQYFDKSCLA